MSGAIAGVLPHLAMDYTPRMLVAALEAHAKRQVNELTLATFLAWKSEAYHRTTRLPSLRDELAKLSPPKIMSPQAMRSAIMDIARNMGAKITHRKKEG